MGVDHRRFDIRVTQQFLDRADIVSRFQQVRREGMPEGMAGRALANARSPDGVVVKIRIRTSPRSCRQEFKTIQIASVLFGTPLAQLARLRL